MKKKATVRQQDDPPPLTREDFASGRVVLRKRGADGRVLPGKQRVNIFLDRAVIDHFRALAGERGYQTLINESLRDVVRGAGLASVIRQTIREELREALGSK